MTRTHRTLSVLAAVLLAPLALVRCADAAPEPQDTAAAETPSPKAAAAIPTLAWPVAVDARHVTAKFGTLPNPLSPGTWYFHKGIDIAWYPGAPVVAAAAGTVMCAEDDPASDYGCMVMIDHGSGLHTRYAHLGRQLLPDAGETVQRGQRIGSVGNTGKSVGYHLHFELILDGQPVDPLPHLEAAPK